MSESTNTAKHIAHSANNALHEAVPALQHAADRVQALANESLEAIKEGSLHYRDQMLRMSSDANTLIRHHPVQSVLIGALLGATVVTLMSLLRRRD